MPSPAASSSSSASAPLKFFPAILAAIEASVQKSMQDTIQKSVAESVAASSPLVAKAVSQDLASGPVADAIVASESRLSAQIEGVDKKARKEERKLGERISAHECEAAQRFEAMERQLASQQALCSRLAERLSIAESAAPPPKPPAHNFEREPDQSIIVISCKAMVERSKVADAISEWRAVADAGSEDVACLEGKELGRRFVLSFKGAPGIASLRVRKALDSLRISPGKWFDFTVLAPDNSSQRLNVGPDKNGKQIRMEVEGRKLLTALKLEYPALRLFLNKATGAISCQFQDIVRVVPAEEGSPSTLQFALVNAGKFGVAPERTRCIFRDAVLPRPEVVWEALP